MLRTVCVLLLPLVWAVAAPGMADCGSPWYGGLWQPLLLRAGAASVVVNCGGPLCVLLLPLVLYGGPWYGLWRPLIWALPAPGEGFGGPYFVGFCASGIFGRDGPWCGMWRPLVWAVAASDVVFGRHWYGVWCLWYFGQVRPLVWAEDAPGFG
jgi:hypothetical protein